LLDWCGQIMGQEPVRVLGVGSSAAEFATLFLEFAGARMARITRQRAPLERSQLRIEANLEGRVVSARWPRRLSWIDGEGRHLQRLRSSKSAEHASLEQFAESVQQGTLSFVALERAHRALRWLRGGVQSLAEERWIELSPPVR